jgi:ubiquinone/menaquinone biosynthesis C-methylase UbiE
LVRQIVSGWRTQAIHAAVQLRFPDHLAAGPLTSDELAAAAECEPGPATRLLRALCVLGVCREDGGGRFRLTRAGRLLCTDGGGEGSSLRPLVEWWGGPLWPVWSNLAYSVRTGHSAREKLMGDENYRYIERDAVLANTFHGAMSAMTALVTDEVVAWSGWHEAETVVDVGGGHGQLLLAVLAAHPHLRGVVFDMATALSGACSRIAGAGLEARAHFEAGDFFTSLPAGADCYVMKSILHNWDDERCRVILDNCRRMASPHARLLIVERIRPQRLRECVADEGVARTDLNMLAGLGGRERTLREFAALLKDAGFSVTSAARTSFEFSLLEARRCD